MLHFVDLQSALKKETPTYGHTMNLVSSSNSSQIYFLGGFGYKETFNFTIYDILQEGFGEPKVEGDKPNFRGFHTTNLYDNNLYIYGGTNEENIFSNIYLLNTKTFSFKLLNDTGLHRFGHSSVILNGKMISFGGYSKSETITCLEEYNFLKNEWKEIKSINTPLNRCFHSCIEINGIIFIHGGLSIQDGNEKYLNDLFMFRDGYWTKISSSNKSNLKSTPKFGHSILFHNERIYILGGVSSSNLSNKNGNQLIDKSIEYLNEFEVKPKSISAKSKIDLIFSKTDVNSKFQKYLEKENMIDYYNLKKLILDYKLKSNKRIEITQEILLKLGNNEKGIIWILNRDYSKLISNIKEKNYFNDLFSTLELEIDSILLNLIHRYYFD
eukprot:gene1907-1047_t